VKLLWLQDTHESPHVHLFQTQGIAREARAIDKWPDTAMSELERMHRQAIEAVASCNYAVAQPLLESCLSQAEAHFAGNQVLPVVLRDLAQCHAARGNNDHAKDFFRLALAWDGQATEQWSRLRADIGTAFAVHLGNRSDLWGAADVWHGVRGDLANLKDSEGEIAALAKEAEVRRNLKEYEEAESLYQQACTLAKQSTKDCQKVLVPLLFDLACVCALLSKHKEALCLFRQVQTLSQDRELLDSCGLRSARIHFCTGQLAKAQRFLAEIIKHARVAETWTTN
jgi:tetratricopeptide (TPR) repeat protein